MTAYYIEIKDGFKETIDKVCLWLPTLPFIGYWVSLFRTNYQSIQSL